MIIIGVTSWSETGSSSKDVKEISRDRLQERFQLDSHLLDPIRALAERLNMKPPLSQEEYPMI